MIASCNGLRNRAQVCPNSISAERLVRIVWQSTPSSNDKFILSNFPPTCRTILSNLVRGIDNFSWQVSQTSAGVNIWCVDLHAALYSKPRTGSDITLNGILWAELDTKKASTCNLDVTSLACKSIGADVAILFGDGNDKGSVDSDVAPISALLGSASTCGYLTAVAQ